MDEATHPDDQRAFASQAAWREWLAENFASSAGIWIQLAKKGSGIPTVTYAEALDVALCYGWIDGQKRPLDDSWWLQRFTRRTKRSGWSKVNREHIARLTAAGLMQPTGQLEVDRAKADGRWDAAYDSSRTSTVPADLTEALNAEPEAAAFFATLNAANRYSHLYAVQTAKKPETRTRRIAKIVSMCLSHEKPHP